MQNKQIHTNYIILVAKCYIYIVYETQKSEYRV